MSALLLAIVALLACSDPPQCDEAVPCTGFAESCVEGSCVAQSCATSAQCPMESHCDAGECLAGCGDDGDCYPGDSCSSDGSCQAASCSDSQLDCAFQEFCDPASGDCYAAEGYWCRECEVDGDCGGNGNLCLSWGDNGEFCGVSCAADADCPAGYTCSLIDDAAGNPISSQCISWCWLYAEHL